jgi:hypothetical protein
MMLLRRFSWDIEGIYLLDSNGDYQQLILSVPLPFKVFQLIQRLKHKRSQLVELKDSLMTGEISYPAFQKAAYPLQKEIRALEASTL